MKVVTVRLFPATLIVKAVFENSKKEAHMKHSKFLTLTLAIAIIFAGVVPAIAGGFDGMGRGHWGRPGIAGLKTFLNLNLTDAQKSKLLNILDKYQTERKNVVRDSFEARRNLIEALHSEPFNEVNVRAAFERLSSIKEDSFILRVRMRSEMKTVLTSDQIALLQKRHKENFEGIRHRLNAPSEAPVE
jgi:Spy/CpxP family protein refolding chaperone